MKTWFLNPNTDSSASLSFQRDESRTLTLEELAGIPFFEGLGKEDLQEIAAHTKYSHFEIGDELMTQGDAADRFYIIESGKVRVTCNLPDIQLNVEDIGPGGVVGFSWLFTPEKVHFSAKALEPVKAVFVYGTLLKESFAKSPRLAYEMSIRTGKVMLERLESVVDMIGGVRFVEG